MRLILRTLHVEGALHVADALPMVFHQTLPLFLLNDGVPAILNVRTNVLVVHGSGAAKLRAKRAPS